MISAATDTEALRRACDAATVMLLLFTAAGCSRENLKDGPEPFVLPEATDESQAPFRGPTLQVDQRLEEAQPQFPAEVTAAPTGELSALPAPAVAEIAAPAEALATTRPDRRRGSWLNERFRCKAISSTRLRRCRFEQTADGYRLRFPMSDVTCEGVTFDERGDPERLTGCRGSWLRVPVTNRLRPNRDHRVWSGSHSGWRWKGDQQPYCCPGLWLEAPESLRSL
ncbi:MAG: hypothetical protein JRF63_06890 [Deltaproteobacteria bacterium]|nr:hypothetical protein [Deltaproteobacteria bacterium]